MLEVNGLVKHYGHVVALDGLDLRIEAGEVAGLVGHNGAGKTTAVEVILGLVRPDAGSIRVGGIDALTDPRRARALTGVAAQDLQQGLLLIEDLGSRLYLAELNEANADRLYGDAMDALFAMQTRVACEDLPPFDRTVLVNGLEVMPEWFLERHLGHTPSCEEWDVLEAAFDVVIRNALAQPRCFVHRDYHSRNLLVTDTNSPGVIDFQGALYGPLTYDLASLLRDAYIAWPRARVEGWVESYRQRLRHAGVIGDDIDAARFLRWFDLTGLHRHVRVLGQFYRLWYRDGKPGYLADVPQVYRYVIEVARSYPELADFVALLGRHAKGRDLTQAAGA